VSVDPANTIADDEAGVVETLRRPHGSSNRVRGFSISSFVVLRPTAPIG